MSDPRGILDGAGCLEAAFDGAVDETAPTVGVIGAGEKETALRLLENGQSLAEIYGPAHRPRLPGQGVSRPVLACDLENFRLRHQEVEGGSDLLEVCPIQFRGVGAKRDKDGAAALVVLCLGKISGQSAEPMRQTASAFL